MPRKIRAYARHGSAWNILTNKEVFFAREKQERSVGEETVGRGGQYAQSICKVRDYSKTV